MPTYVYKFIATGETIEVQQSFTDDTLTEFTHPDSGETMAVKKVFLPVGVTFKGDGFYKNDSRTKSSTTQPATSSSDAGSSDSSSGSTSSSDSKKTESTSSSTSDSKAPASSSSSSGSSSSD